MPFNPMMVKTRSNALPKEKPKVVKKALGIRIYCWIKLSVAFLIAAGLTSLIFLGLMVVDPALSTLGAHYHPTPVECRVVSSRHIIGLSECDWTSCREGCTGDIFECHQIRVQYQTPPPVTSEASLSSLSSATRSSPLRITIKGCGYPPTVNCSSWIQQFGQNNSAFPCYFSQSDEAPAITHLNVQEAKRDVILSLLIPIAIMITSALSLYILSLSKVEEFFVSKCKRVEVEEEDVAANQKQVVSPEKRILSKKPLAKKLSTVQEYTDELYFNPQKRIISPEEPYVSHKRSADPFDIPRISKKFRKSEALLSDSSSSLEKLLSEKTRSKIISWRRNTKSITDQIVMNNN